MTGVTRVGLRSFASNQRCWCQRASSGWGVQAAGANGVQHRCFSHWHIKGREEPYRFVSVAKLRRDFSLEIAMSATRRPSSVLSEGAEITNGSQVPPANAKS